MPEDIADGLDADGAAGGHDRDVATFFKATPRRAAALCARWVAEGFLAVADPSKKYRRYGLAAQYESLVAGRAAGLPTADESPQP